MRRKRFEYLVQVDIQQGCSKKGFQALRPRPRPSICSLPTVEQRDATLIQLVGPRSGLYTTTHVEFLRASAPVSGKGLVAFLDKILPGDDDVDMPDRILLTFQDSAPPPNFCFTQTTQAVTPQELHREFYEFWSDIWWRDTKEAEKELDRWPEFLAMLPAPPPGVTTLDLELTALRTWEEAVRVRWMV